MPTGYFDNIKHCRMESVDRGAVYNENIASFPYIDSSIEDPAIQYSRLGGRVSSQNPRDRIRYGVDIDQYHDLLPSQQLWRNRDFILPQTLKVFPKSMAYIRVDGSGDNITFRRYANYNQNSIFCTTWDYGFPDPNSDSPAWEPGCRYIGGLFVDQSQNNPL